MEWHERELEARQQAVSADVMHAQLTSSHSRGRRRSKPRFDVVGFGALNLDHLYAVPQLLQDGGVEVTTSTVQAGGSAANTIYGLARLGLRCGFVGIVGDDGPGNIVLESFKEVGVDTGGILVKPGVATGHTICITAGQGQKAIYIVPGANDLLDSYDLDLAYLGDTRYVHISSFVGKSAFRQQLRVVEQLPPGAKISLALDAIYARHGLHAMSGLLRRCALVFANVEELRELAGQDLCSAAHACLDTGCEAVVVTFGAGTQQEHGPSSHEPQDNTAAMVVAKRRGGRGQETIAHTIPAVRTHHGEIVDTVGAGDAFAAGFLFGLLSRRYGLAKSGALGHTAAGFSLTQLGARKGLPTQQELLARYAEVFQPPFDPRGRKVSIAGSIRRREFA